MQVEKDFQANPLFNLSSCDKLDAITACYFIGNACLK